jgi:hypothetical protein
MTRATVSNRSAKTLSRVGIIFATTGLKKAGAEREYSFKTSLGPGQSREQAAQFAVPAQGLVVTIDEYLGAVTCTPHSATYDDGTTWMGGSPL